MRGSLDLQPGRDEYFFPQEQDPDYYSLIEDNSDRFTLIEQAQLTISEFNKLPAYIRCVLVAGVLTIAADAYMNPPPRSESYAATKPAFTEPYPESVNFPITSTNNYPTEVEVLDNEFQIRNYELLPDDENGYKLEEIKEPKEFVDASQPFEIEFFAKGGGETAVNGTMGIISEEKANGLRLVKGLMSRHHFLNMEEWMHAFKGMYVGGKPIYDVKILANSSYDNESLGGDVVMIEFLQEVEDEEKNNSHREILNGNMPLDFARKFIGVEVKSIGFPLSVGDYVDIQGSSNASRVVVTGRLSDATVSSEGVLLYQMKLNVPHEVASTLKGISGAPVLLPSGDQIGVHVGYTKDAAGDFVVLVAGIPQLDQAIQANKYLNIEPREVFDYLENPDTTIDNINKLFATIYQNYDLGTAVKIVSSIEAAADAGAYDFKYAELVDGELSVYCQYKDREKVFTVSEVEISKGKKQIVLIPKDLG